MKNYKRKRNHRIKHRSLGGWVWLIVEFKTG